jgi:hypothetical protein
MASRYTINSQDLDNIFKPRSSAKIANVNIRVQGVDISNRYERSQNTSDRITFNTNIRIGNSDLRTLFASKTARKLTFSYYTVGETWERYGRRQDGQIHVTILQANYNQSGGHNYSVRVYGGNTSDAGSPSYSDTTQNTIFNTDSQTFSFFRLNGYKTFNYGSVSYRTFTVIITDNISGKTHTFTIPNIGISYSGPTIYNQSGVITVY